MRGCALVGTLQLIVAIYLAVINVTAFLMFRSDKRRSELRVSRIPERKLLTAAFWGGSLGALIGQQILRHKTRKQPFRFQLLAIAVTHLLIVSVLGLPEARSLVFKILFH
jgi:uncharacterized membrane protein YsdA (DUF1294 family)